MENIKQLTLKECVIAFSDGLEEIFGTKILGLSAEYKEYSKILEVATSEKSVRLHEVLLKRGISQEEWEFYWLFAQVADFDFNKLKRKVAEIKVELDNIINAYNVWKQINCSNDNALNVETAKEYPITSLYVGELKKKGNLLTGCCPFHGEASPSFFVYPNNSFFCFGCGKGGTVIDFVMLSENVDFVSAVRRLS
jgi:hypothetical protein